MLRDWRLRTVLILLFLFLVYKFALFVAVFGIWPKHTNLPGPRYFSGYVSEAEIYAGAINVALENEDYAIVYLKDSTKKAQGKKGQKRLSPAVESLARRPFRPIIADDREVAPIRVPIRRVATITEVKGKDCNVINRGLYVSVGHIRVSGLNSIRISVRSSFGGGDDRHVDYMVKVILGRLVFETISELVS